MEFAKRPEDVQKEIQELHARSVNTLGRSAPHRNYRKYTSKLMSNTYKKNRHVYEENRRNISEKINVRNRINSSIITPKNGAQKRIYTKLRDWMDEAGEIPVPVDPVNVAHPGIPVHSSHLQSVIFPTTGPLKNPKNMRNTFTQNITRRASILRGYKTPAEGISVAKSHIEKAVNAINVEDKKVELIQDEVTRLTQRVADMAGKRGVGKIKDTLRSTSRRLKDAEKQRNNVVKKALIIQQNHPYINIIGRSHIVAKNIVAPWERKQQENDRLIMEDKLNINEGRKRPTGWGLNLYEPFEPIDFSGGNNYTAKKIQEGSLIANVSKLKEYSNEFLESQKPIDLALLGEVYGVNKTTTMYEFIGKLFLNPNLTLDELVSFYFVENRPVTGCDSFEVLCRLFVFLGGMIDIDPKEDGDYKFVERIDINRIKQQQYILYKTNSEALKDTTCIATSESGVSDITLMHNDIFSSSATIERPKIYLMSVKWFGEEKSAEKYDIEKLSVQADRTVVLESRTNLKVPTLQHLTRPDIHILVFLKNRGAFVKKCGNAVSTRGTENICEQFIGWYEDIRPFLERARNDIFTIADRKHKIPMTIFNELYNIH